jgi:transcriptional regulator with XRE-family HTH domain
MVKSKKTATSPKSRYKLNKRLGGAKISRTKGEVGDLQKAVFTKEYFERLRRLENAGDSSAVARLKFGRYLAMLRNLNKMSQSQVADKLKTSVRTVIRYETGERLPPREKLSDIANLFGADLNGLYDRAGYLKDADFAVFDESDAVEDFKTNLQEADSEAAFLLGSSIIWQKYRHNYFVLQYTNNELAETLNKAMHVRIDLALNKAIHVHIDLAFINAVCSFKMNLSAQQKLQVFKELLTGEEGIEVFRDPHAVAILKEIIDEVKVHPKLKPSSAEKHNNET